jgi:hypothetical protein
MFRGGWLVLTLSLSQADLRIESYLGHASLTAMPAFLKTDAYYVRDDMHMPYALCVIGEVPSREWVATGFISNYVAKSIYKWVHASVLDQSEIFEHLRDPFSYDLLGGIFGELIDTALGTTGKELRVSHQNNDLDFTFSDIQSYEWCRGKNEKDQTSQVQLKNRVFYTPDDVDSSLIDGYAMYDDFLLLVQATVATSICGVNLLAVENIVVAAQEANRNIKVCLVYDVPQARVSDFRSPMCDELVGVGAAVCVGVITDEDGLIARYVRVLS